MFAYEVNSFGTFQEKDSATSAPAAYFHVLASGLQWAKESDSENKRLMPLSGRKLFLGRLQVTDFFQIHNIPHSGVHGHGVLAVSQGELWTEKERILPLDWAIQADSEESDICIFSTSPSLPREGLLVKVYSPSVHTSFLRIEEQQKYGLTLLHGEKKALSAVNDVFVAVIFKRDPGSFTMIMKDLRTSHVALQPKKLSKVLPALWKNGMRPLVMNKLLPLARSKFIHCDIRAGFDCTANILISNDFETNPDKIDPDLKLIDFESIIKFRKRTTLPADSRYPDTLTNCHSALGCVWWQILNIGCSWVLQIPAGDVDLAYLLHNLETATSHVGENDIKNLLNAMEQALLHPPAAAASVAADPTLIVKFVQNFVPLSN